MVAEFGQHAHNFEFGQRTFHSFQRRLRIWAIFAQYPIVHSIKLDIIQCGRVQSVSSFGPLLSCDQYLGCFRNILKEIFDFSLNISPQ